MTKSFVQAQSLDLDEVNRVLRTIQQTHAQTANTVSNLSQTLQTQINSTANSAPPNPNTTANDLAANVHTSSTNTVTHKVALPVNGTTYYFLASTSST